MPALNGSYTPNYNLYLLTVDDEIDDALLAVAANFGKLDAALLALTGNVNARQKIFVQPDQPTVPGPWVWFQTGLGPTGNDMTIWVEDGLP